MNTLKRKWCLLLLAISALIVAPSTSTADYCNLCDRSSCDLGCVNIDLDFLYWSPCIDDLDYATVVTPTSSGGVTTTNVDHKRFCLDWEPGVRITLGLPDIFCGWGTTATYTYMGSCDKRKTSFDDGIGEFAGVSSPLLNPAVVDNDTLYEKAKGSWDLSYHEWDLLFGHDIIRNQCHLLKPFLGVAGIYLEQEIKVDLTETSGESSEIELKWDNEYWGVGLRTGMEYAYRIKQCLSLFGKVQGTLLAGEVCNKNKQTIEIGSGKEIFKFNEDDHCIFVSGYSIGTGVLYDACFCDTEFSLKLGYEFVSWHNIPNQRVYTGRASEELGHSTSPNTRTLGFHGLIAGVSVNF